MASQKPLRICLATSELAPFAKTGGLADVSAALSSYLHETGHDVRVLMPRYARLDVAACDVNPVAGLERLKIRIGSREIPYAIDVTTLPGRKLPVYLLRCPALYGRDAIYTEDGDEHLRFVLLSRAAIEMCRRLGFAPDIFHSHDWHTSLIPLYLKSIHAGDSLFRGSRSVLTIHNIGYQGVFPDSAVPDLGLDGAETLLDAEDLRLARVNFLKTGILHADLVTVVSPTYAREIRSPEYGMGLDESVRRRGEAVVGILNGVDYSEWDPRHDPLIPANYGPGKLRGKARCKRELMAELGLSGMPRAPLIGIVSRLVAQKGMELVEHVIPRLLERRQFSMAILGSGEAHFEQFFNSVHHHYPDRVAFHRGYNDRLAHRIEAGSDMFMMPSRYEPCGLNQMYSLRYGTVPIVRATGGLADSVEPFDPADGSGTGIVFRHYDATGLEWAVNHALDLFDDRANWRKMMANGMARDFSWERQGAKYVDLFQRLIG